MKEDKFFLSVGILFIVFAILCGISWPINAYRLSNCDFESDYKCEFLHGVGLFIPPASIVTVWFGVDE